MAMNATLASTRNVLFKHKVDQTLRKNSTEDEEFEYIAIADVIYQKKENGQLTGVRIPTGSLAMKLTGGDHRICVAVRATNPKTGRSRVTFVLLKPVQTGRATKKDDLPLKTCQTDGTFRTNSGYDMLSAEPGDTLKVVKHAKKHNTYILEDTNMRLLQTWRLSFQLQILDSALEGGYNGSAMMDLLDKLEAANRIGKEEVEVVNVEPGEAEEAEDEAAPSN